MRVLKLNTAPFPFSQQIPVRMPLACSGAQCAFCPFLCYLTFFGVFMSRNYGLGSRDMTRAASVVLNNDRSQGAISYATVANTLNRFDKFKDFAKERGIGKFERVTRELVQEYAQSLKETALSPSYQQNLLSAVNSVMSRVSAHAGSHWKSVSARAEGIQQRSFIRTETTASRSQSQTAIQSMSPRAAVVANLARELGLRSKEAALLNNHTALREAETRGVVTILEGTKGGRSRTVPITNQNQISALKNAASIQGKDRCVIPATQNWNQFRNGELNNNREVLQAQGIKGYHDLRSAYAAERYEQLTGHAAPANGGSIFDRNLDKVAREQISSELGHGRIDVVSEYIGGR